MFEQGIVGNLVCKIIGHSWRENQPKKLLHSPHRRKECRWCGTMKWEFSSRSQEELDDIVGIISGGGNRAQRRKVAKKSVSDPSTADH